MGKDKGKAAYSSEKKKYLKRLRKALTFDSDTLTADELAKGFSQLDLDGNGYLGVAEMRTILHWLGYTVTDDEVERMVKLIDSDGDGQADFGEFSKFLCSAQLADDVPDDILMSLDMDAKKLGIKAYDGEKEDILATDGSTEKAAKAAKLVSEDGTKLKSKFLTETHRVANEFFTKKHHFKTHQLEKMIHKFHKMDRDFVGKINMREFQDIVSKANKHAGESPDDLQKVFKAYEFPEGIGTVDAREVLTGLACLLHGADLDAIVQCIFDIFSHDGDDTLNADELNIAVKGTHFQQDIKPIRNKCIAILAEMDGNGDGVIDRDEMKTFAKKFPGLVFPSAGSAEKKKEKKHKRDKSKEKSSKPGRSGEAWNE